MTKQDWIGTKSDESIEVKIIAAASDGLVNVTPEKIKAIQSLLDQARKEADSQHASEIERIRGLEREEVIKKVESAIEEWKAEGRDPEHIYAINNFLTGAFNKVKQQ